MRRWKICHEMRQNLGCCHYIDYTLRTTPEQIVKNNNLIQLLQLVAA